MSNVLRRGIIQSGLGGGAPEGLQWLTKPSSPSARGINLIDNLTINTDDNEGVGVQYLQFDFFLAEDSYTGDMSFIADSTDTAGDDRSIYISSGTTLKIFGGTINTSITNIFDGEIHTLRIEKTTPSISARFNVTIDGDYKGRVTSSSNIRFDNIAGTLNQSGYLGLKGLVANLVSVNEGGITEFDMPISEGSGTVIINNGTLSNGAIVNAVDGVDYQWDT